MDGFPPMYTLQLHDGTRARQLALWTDTLARYCKSTSTMLVNTTAVAALLANAPSASGDSAETDAQTLVDNVLSNSSIQRTASPELFAAIIKHMLATGIAISLDQKNGKDDSTSDALPTEVAVLWQPIESFARDTIAWALGSGGPGKGAVTTVYELVSGSSAAATGAGRSPIAGLPGKVASMAIRRMAEDGNIALFSAAGDDDPLVTTAPGEVFEDDTGIKFY